MICSLAREEPGWIEAQLEAAALALERLDVPVLDDFAGPADAALRGGGHGDGLGDGFRASTPRCGERDGGGKTKQKKARLFHSVSLGRCRAERNIAVAPGGPPRWTC